MATGLLVAVVVEVNRRPVAKQVEILVVGTRHMQVHTIFFVDVRALADAPFAGALLK